VGTRAGGPYLIENLLVAISYSLFLSLQVIGRILASGTYLQQCVKCNVNWNETYMASRDIGVATMHRYHYDVR
jgi:hypothetical protein